MKYFVLIHICAFLFHNLTIGAHDPSYLTEDPDFRFGDEPAKYVIYRLIGNDMPPLQTRGQLRWNTLYALENEPNFPGVHKRWILNRIWNESEFESLYNDLVGHGVLRRDILSRCLDLDAYNSFKSMDDKLFYLTSQNEGRNAGIIDGRDSGFEWTIILDGNTFITADSWRVIQDALEEASASRKLYMKIPYHRVHSMQNTTWLNKKTTMKTIVEYAPTKGESQLAFHRNARDLFTLGDTKPDNKDPSKRKGYGQRNKSYMFKDGQICGPGSKICQCADVIEGNEEDIKGKELGSYTKKCGLVLRLWNYPTEDVIHTGLSKKDEEGFFCFVKTVESRGTECERVRHALQGWSGMDDVERKRFRGEKAEKCKTEYNQLILTESCFRAADREIAQLDTANALATMTKNKYDSRKSLCNNLRPPPTDPRRKHFLTVFDEVTLEQEKKAWQNKQSAFSKAIDPLLKDLIAKADHGLKLGPYSVTFKKRTPPTTTDKKYYYSVRPYYWPLEDLPKDLQKEVKSGELELDKNGLLHRDGFRVPGTIIGGEGEDLYDRASAFFAVDNITTLALSWYFTEDDKYAKYASQLVHTFFLDDVTGMYPNLDHAQAGERQGLIDWKDVYYFLDALTLLEKSGQFTLKQVLSMQRWCAQLARWYMKSTMGHIEGSSLNNHALYFDLSTLSLSVYAKDDDLCDMARQRLFFRLSKVAPVGHFELDGSQPHEVVRPTSLHYVTFNLIGWIHVTLVNEASRQHSELPGSFRSLWWVKHEPEEKKEKSIPVLLKAIRWLTQYLPSDAKQYTRWQEPVKGMTVKFPYSQADHYAFDRLLEIVHYGVQVYGVKMVFPFKPTDAVTAALNFPLYSTNMAMFNKYTSVDPDSGARVWTALGLYANRTVASGH